MCFNKTKRGETLYHYCSLDSFINIMIHKKIRFSDVTKSNDSEEIFLLLNKYLSEKEEKTSPVSLESFKREVLKDLGGRTYYCFCLSELKDVLSQWRGYAPQGGVAIGFSKEKLKKWAQTIKVSEIDVAQLIDVEYINMVEDEKLAKELKALGPIHVNNYGKILELMPKYKNDGFKEERESRIVFSNFTKGQNGMKLPSVRQNDNICELGFCIFNGSDFRSYYDIPFDYDMIKEIIIGPKLNVSLSDIEVILSYAFPQTTKFKEEQISIEKTRLSFR